MSILYHTLICWVSVAVLAQVEFEHFFNCPRVDDRNRTPNRTRVQSEAAEAGTRVPTVPVTA